MATQSYNPFASEIDQENQFLPDVITYDDLGSLGIDWGSIISQGAQAAQGVEANRQATRQAQAAARIAAANAAAEDARTQAIIAGRAPSGIPVMKVAMWAGIAVVGSIVAVKLLRRSRR